jgi:hypothetical protein
MLKPKSAAMQAHPEKVLPRLLPAPSLGHGLLVETIAHKEPLALMHPSMLLQSNIFTEGDFAVAPANGKTCVATCSLKSCIGLSIYDRQNSVAGGLHAYFWAHDTDGEIAMATMNILFNRMLESAGAIGGRSYEMDTFNLEEGYRNTPLTEKIREAVIRMAGSDDCVGRITCIRHRDARNFVIDSRDGSIHTGRWYAEK